MTAVLLIIGLAGLLAFAAVQVIPLLRRVRQRYRDWRFERHCRQALTQTITERTEREMGGVR